MEIEPHYLLNFGENEVACSIPACLGKKYKKLECLQKAWVANKIYY